MYVERKEHSLYDLKEKYQNQNLYLPPSFTLKLCGVLKATIKKSLMREGGGVGRWLTTFSLAKLI